MRARSPSPSLLLIILLIVGCESTRPEPEPLASVVARRQQQQAARQAAIEARLAEYEAWRQRQMAEPRAAQRQAYADNRARLAAREAEYQASIPALPALGAARSPAEAAEAIEAAWLRAVMRHRDGVPEATAVTRARALTEDCLRRWPRARAGEVEPGQHVWSVTCLLGGPGEVVGRAEGGVVVRRWRLPGGRVVASFQNERVVAVVGP